jgi:hypothetical protein
MYRILTYSYIAAAGVPASKGSGGTGMQLTSDTPRSLGSQRGGVDTKLRHSRPNSSQAQGHAPGTSRAGGGVPAMSLHHRTNLLHASRLLWKHTRSASFVIAKAAWLKSHPLRRPDRIQSGPTTGKFDSPKKPSHHECAFCPRRKGLRSKSTRDEFFRETASVRVEAPNLSRIEVCGASHVLVCSEMLGRAAISLLVEFFRRVDSSYYPATELRPGTENRSPCYCRVFLRLRVDCQNFRKMR